ILRRAYVPAPRRRNERTLLSATKSHRQQIELGRIRAAGLRLDVLYGGKVALQRRQQRWIGPALQHLGEEAAARTQNLAGELDAGLHQRHDLELIGLLVAGRIRG